MEVFDYVAVTVSGSVSVEAGPLLPGAELRSKRRPSRRCMHALPNITRPTAGVDPPRSDRQATQESGF